MEEKKIPSDVREGAETKIYKVHLTLQSIFGKLATCQFYDMKHMAKHDNIILAMGRVQTSPGSDLHGKHEVSNSLIERDVGATKL